MGLRRCWAAACSIFLVYHTLIKKKTKFSSYVRKFRGDRVQMHIWLTSSSYMTKYLCISSNFRKPFFIYDFAPEFPYIWGKFSFLFYPCSYRQLLPAPCYISRADAKPSYPLSRYYERVTGKFVSCWSLRLQLRVLDLFKGTVSRDFLLQVFSWITFPQAPDNNIRIISNFFENSRRY